MPAGAGGPRGRAGQGAREGGPEGASFGALQLRPRERAIRLRDLEALEAGPAEPQADLSGVTQQELRELVPEQAARSIFELTLPSGPYIARYDPVGATMLLAGERGHLGLVRLADKQLLAESHLEAECVRDATFLHNRTLFAVARKREVTILDDHCLEIHNIACERPLFLQFLPAHWLLAYACRQGVLRYRDVTTGEEVASIITRLGTPSCMRQNPANALVGLSFSGKSFLNLYAPSSKGLPSMSVDCHAHGIQAFDFSRDGSKLVTLGTDRLLKIWDLRNVAAEVFCGVLPSPAGYDVHFSEMEKIAVSYANRVDFYDSGFLLQYSVDKLAARGGRGAGGPDAAPGTGGGTTSDPAAPPPLPGERFIGAEGAVDLSPKFLYMTHAFGGNRTRFTNSLAFRPHFDDCALGLSTGIQSILVPGSGDPRIDSFTANVYEGARQRGERTVRGLLEKVPHELIGAADALTAVHRPSAAEEVHAKYGAIYEAMANAGRRKGPRSLTAKHIAREGQRKAERERQEKIREVEARRRRRFEAGGGGADEGELRAAARPRGLGRFSRRK